MINMCWKMYCVTQEGEEKEIKKENKDNPKSINAELLSNITGKIHVNTKFFYSFLDETSFKNS